MLWYFFTSEILNIVLVSQGRSVTLKIKTDRFKLKTRVCNLLEHTDEAIVIEKAAKSILRHFMETADEKPLRLRLLGELLLRTIANSSGFWQLCRKAVRTS